MYSLWAPAKQKSINIYFQVGVDQEVEDAKQEKGTRSSGEADKKTKQTRRFEKESHGHVLLVASK